MPTPKTEIFLVSFRRDFEFATYCLRSIKKFCTGFAGTTVLVPHTDAEMFGPICAETGAKLRTFLEMPGKGMLHHELCILESDIWCPEAEYILHVDSDCCFIRPTTPDDYFVEGRPVMLRERFEDFKQYETRYSWKKCVEEALGFPVEWETMVRHPAIFDRRVYRETRFIIERGHSVPVTQYVLSKKNDFPQTFAEFPTLGAVALSTGFPVCWVDFKSKNYGGWEGTDTSTHRGSYSLLSGPEERDIVPHLWAGWTHGGVTPEVKTRLEGFLK